MESPRVPDGSRAQDSFESFFDREHARLQRALFVLVGDTGEAESAYGEETYRRLVALKDKYDPTNVFRLNQNIVPSA